MPCVSYFEVLYRSSLQACAPTSDSLSLPVRANPNVPATRVLTRLSKFNRSSSPLDPLTEYKSRSRPVCVER